MPPSAGDTITLGKALEQGMGGGQRHPASDPGEL